MLSTCTFIRQLVLSSYAAEDVIIICWCSRSGGRRHPSTAIRVGAPILDHQPCTPRTASGIRPSRYNISTTVNPQYNCVLAPEGVGAGRRKVGDSGIACPQWTLRIHCDQLTRS